MRSETLVCPPAERAVRLWAHPVALAFMIEDLRRLSIMVQPELAGHSLPSDWHAGVRQLAAFCALCGISDRARSCARRTGKSPASYSQPFSARSTVSEIAHPPNSPSPSDRPRRRPYIASGGSPSKEEAGRATAPGPFRVAYHRARYFHLRAQANRATLSSSARY